jgi:hypothetical protein
MCDKIAKGRQAKGEKLKQVLPRGSAHKRAKLTEIQVVEIRKLAASGVAILDIARKFQMGRQMISLIIARKYWTHI